MKSIINRYCEYDRKTHTYSYTPWYLGKNCWGGRLVSSDYLTSEGVPSYLGIAYESWEMDAVIMYPKPLHLVVRVLRKYYWKIMRSFKSLGLIDTPQGNMFSWSDFFRIKR